MARLECFACGLTPSAHVGRSNWALLRPAENGDMRALQVYVGRCGWMCRLVMYNFCEGARSESGAVVLHV